MESFRAFLVVTNLFRKGRTSLSVLVLGIGNLVMTDDGVGVRVVQCLASSYVFPAGVTVLDGGTLGLDLLPFLEGLDPSPDRGCNGDRGATGNHRPAYRRRYSGSL